MLLIPEQTLRLMSDDHLIASAHAAFDPIVSTPLERELLRRLEQYERETEMIEFLYSQGYDTLWSLRELLEQPLEPDE